MVSELSYADTQKIKLIISEFDVIDGEVKKVTLFRGGRINKTYKVTIKGEEAEKEYLLQEINTNVFKDPHKLMTNVVRVATFINDLNDLDWYGTDKPAQSSIRFIKNKKTQTFLYVTDERFRTADVSWIIRNANVGRYYRCYEFIEADVYDCINSPDDMKKLGNAVAEFANVLADYPANVLFETIPDFHNTQKRFENFLISVYKCSIRDYGRVYEVKDLINKIIERKNIYSVIVNGLKTGDIPTRVTHNDPKLNNVLFDKETGKVKCLIDLDTVMPGSILYDVGDAIRYGANTASEEETDVEKVDFDVELCNNFMEGFIDVMGDKLTDTEKENLYLAPQIMTWELAIRFLTDYLDGNVYFGVSYDKQNLDRAKVQIKLAESMEEKKMEVIVFLEEKLK